AFSWQSFFSASHWKLSSFWTKKETFRSRLIASYMLAWQRPTLAERKSAYNSPKMGSAPDRGARIFPHLHSFLTQLPLVSSFRRSLSSSASNAFSWQSFFSASHWKLSSFWTKKETFRSRLIASYMLAWQRPTLAERKSDYHRR